MSKSLLPFTITSYEDAIHLSCLITGLKHANSGEDGETALDIIATIKESNFETIEEDITDNWNTDAENHYNACSKLMREFACDVIYDYMENEIDASIKSKIQKLEDKKQELENRKRKLEKIK